MKARIAKAVIVSWVVLLTLSPTESPALDVGDPVFGSDVPGNARLEFIYENYDREATIELNEITFSGPGGVVTVAGSDEDSDTEGADTNGTDLSPF